MSAPLNLRRTKAVAYKEFLHVIRDPRSLGMAVAIPMLLLVLFGYALTLDVDHVPMVVWDRSQTAQSRDFISRFTGSSYFSLKNMVWSHKELERAIDTGQAMMGMVIDSDFPARLAQGRKAEVQLIVDGSDSNTATIAIGYADVIVRTFSQDVLAAEIRRKGMRPLAAPLEIRPRVWFNEEMKSKNYIVPGLIAVIMMVIAALLTSLTVAREWERGTMEQLIATPVRAPELVLGKLVPYFAIGLTDVAIAIYMGEFVFDVPLRGNAALLFGAASVFLAGVLCMGVFISIAAKNQLMATQLSMVLTFLPAFLLSGFMYAISNMPYVIQVVTYLVPARYFVAVMKGIYLKGVGLEILGLDMALLILFGLFMMFLSIVKFKKKLA